MDIVVKNIAPKTMNTRQGAKKSVDRVVYIHVVVKHALRHARLVKNLAPGKSSMFSSCGAQMNIVMNFNRICAHYSCPIPCGSVSETWCAVPVLHLIN